MTIVSSPLPVRRRISPDEFDRLAKTIVLQDKSLSRGFVLVKNDRDRNSAIDRVGLSLGEL